MKLIRLSTPFDTDHSMPQPITVDSNINFKMLFTRERDGFNIMKITMTSHSGSHVDAPQHRFYREEKKGMYWLEDVPLDYLYGETVVFDMPRGAREGITARDFENAGLEIKEGDIVLVSTGWGRYFEKDLSKNETWVCLNRPGLTLDGAEYLVKKRIRAYGQDTIGTHQPTVSWFLDEKSRAEGVRWMAEPVHQMMLGNDVMLLEHLTNLDLIANRRIVTGFFPLPLRGADGAPVMGVAFLPE